MKNVNLPLKENSFFSRQKKLLRYGALLTTVVFCFAFVTADIFSFTLKDSFNKDFAFSQLKKNKASVLVFLSPECPLCQSYSLTLNELQHKFAANNIHFYGLVPDKSFSDADVNAFAKQYKITMPLLRDSEQKITRYTGATITPEVVVVNEKGATVYRGRIDNWAYELGKKRRVITERELLDVLTAISNGKAIKVKKTKAIGCFIE
jgi:peroxiredoxin